jgi:hypothetical protein
MWDGRERTNPESLKMQLEGRMGDMGYLACSGALWGKMESSHGVNDVTSYFLLGVWAMVFLYQVRWECLT